MRFPVVVMVGLMAACSSVTQLPPLQRTETSAEDLAAAQAVLADYAKRFTEGAPLASGDRLRFIVLGQQELSFEVLVPVEGWVDFPRIGKLTVAGRGVSEIHNDLVKRLSDGYLLNPDVSVHVVSTAPRTLYVLGAVQKAGDFQLVGGRPISLMQALSLAGGFRDEADKRRVLIIRPLPSGERLMVPIDVVELTKEAKGKDPLLLPEDVVFVGTREKIFVFGQVIKAGAYLLHSEQPTTLSQAISMAGGFTRIAKEGSIHLNRRLAGGKQATYVIDVGRILGGHPEEDVELQAGDVIFVPQSFF